ncbi:MAG TPA: hypothetical protein VMV77_21790 [Bacteroidales bacterium]|nr:hypothetical protein [Bacteroidales bacterium]
MVRPGLYGAIKPSGVDFGGIAERSIERILREKRLDEERAVETAKSLRAARDARDEYAVDAIENTKLVEQTGIYSRQVHDVNEDIRNELLRLTDKYQMSGSSEDRINLAMFIQESNQRVINIGNFRKRMEDINGKFSAVDKDNKPVYSLNRNADKQLLYNKILGASDEYTLDLKTLKITDGEGEMEAGDFLTKNFSDMKRYVDPDEAVDKFFKQYNKTGFNKTKSEITDDDGNVTGTQTIYRLSTAQEGQMRKAFGEVFTSDDDVWQEYAADTDNDDTPDNLITDTMFKRGMARNLMAMTTVDIEPAAAGVKPTAAEKTLARKQEMSMKWLPDILSGKKEFGGAGALKDAYRTTEEHGKESVYSAESFRNPKTGKIGIIMRLQTAKGGETIPPLIIEDVSTPAGAAEALKMLPRSIYAMYDELDITPEEMASKFALAAGQMTPERAGELSQVGARVGVERSIDKSLADFGSGALEKESADMVVKDLFAELSKYLPEDVLTKVGIRVGLGNRKKFIDVDKDTFRILNRDTRQTIIDAITAVIKEELAKKTTLATKETVDVSDIFKK